MSHSNNIIRDSDGSDRSDSDSTSDPEEVVHDQKWWYKFRQLSENDYRDFFYEDNHPMNLKKIALQYFIWNDLISYDLVKALVPDIIDINFFDKIICGVIKCCG